LPGARPVEPNTYPSSSPTAAKIARRIIRTARPHGDAHGRGLFRCRRQCVACAQRRTRRCISGRRRRAKAILRGERIIEAALASGAEAIHPGYGFLSENAEFAEAVIDAGLVWVGPPPSSIRAMGLKDAAKKLMIEAGVPVTPGYHRRGPVLRAVAAEAGTNRLSGADQGGRGRRRQGHAAGRRARTSPMRCLVPARGGSELRRRSRADREIHPLAPPYRGAGVRRQPRQCRPPVRARLLAPAPPPEGDRGSARARHGRGDARGDLRGGGARRRRRSTMSARARSSSSPMDRKRCAPDRIWFMEMNTRLQVEHPVTEEITGSIWSNGSCASRAGEPLPKRRISFRSTAGRWKRGSMPRIRRKGFLPSIGYARTVRSGEGTGGRIDTGVPGRGDFALLRSDDRQGDRAWRYPRRGARPSGRDAGGQRGLAGADQCRFL
jgi:3-methylcrotonyl-CoA carboxylase alpha subunit